MANNAKLIECLGSIHAISTGEFPQVKSFSQQRKLWPLDNYLNVKKAAFCSTNELFMNSYTDTSLYCI